jgi:transcriptional regulator with XRE-family HTH domain
MTPGDFIHKWKLNRSELALLLSVSVSTVNQWLAKKPTQQPHPSVLKYLGMIDQTWTFWRQTEEMRQEFPPEIVDLFEVAIDRQELESRSKD